MRAYKLLYLLALMVAVASPALAARGEVTPAATPVTIKPAEGLPAQPTVTPAPLLTQDPPENFDPSAFGTLTTETLPMENGERIVMRVNGRPVSWRDFTIHARLAGDDLLREHPGKVAGVYAALHQPVMDMLLVQELYRAYAEENHLNVHPSEVEQRTAEIQSAREPAMRTAAALLGEDDLKRLVTDNLVREKVMKFIGDEATSKPPTLEELTSYTAATGPTTAPVQLTRASHIVFRATPDMSEFNLKDARARAEEVLAKIRGGLDFATAARQHSQDRFTAYQGGNIGYYAPGTMFPAFEEAARKLEPGEISDIVRTPVGFHIIQVTERHPDDLRLHYEKFKRQQAVEDWLEQAQQQAKVERYLGK